MLAGGTAMAMWDELKRRFNEGSMLMRLIYVNVGVFLVVRLVGIVMIFADCDIDSVLHWLEVPSAWMDALHRPWTVITYSFLHYEVLHILFNMLWLYWLGRIFMEYFNVKQLMALYIYGAIGGAVVYVLASSVLPGLRGMEGYLLGASASVYAIVVAVATYSPNYRIGLLFLGSVALKWVVLAMVLIDLLQMDALSSGGHIAHLGGALVGFLYAMMMRRGHDITAPLNRCIDKIVSLASRRKNPGVGGPVGGRAYRGQSAQGTARNTSQSATGKATESDLDRVLEKIKRSGYTALTDEERDLLFSFSRKGKK
ncbi:rhomboid family intramembrane serine protease [Sodaliphilus sp.]|uniref:rhomboid family intramembrane serine protease n=1 Tax=Sodaliphilus sp. TaxID=2815818 RepID=UPI003890C20A